MQQIGDLKAGEDDFLKTGSAQHVRCVNLVLLAYSPNDLPEVIRAAKDCCGIVAAGGLNAEDRNRLRLSELLRRVGDPGADLAVVLGPVHQ
jgi:hypothetical protein